MASDLSIGKPEKVLWKFCLPLFCSMIFQQLYNIADSLVAGKMIGEGALASVGNSYEITLILIAFSLGCNIGCSVLVSRLFGAKRYGDMKSAISTSCIFSAVMCAVLMVLTLFLAKPLLTLIKTPNEIFADSLAYLNIYVYSLPFVFFYNIATGIFAGLGDSKTPFIFLACSSSANIVADVLFVKMFLKNGLSGVEGVAWATFICQGISCILSVIVVVLKLKKIKTGKFSAWNRSLLKDFLHICIPSICQQSFVSAGNIVIQSIINGFGTSVIAGYASAVKLNNLAISACTTLSNGISNYTAQNVGAGKYSRIKDGLKAGLKIMWVLVLPFVLLYFFFGEYAVRFFMDSPTEEAVRTGKMFLRIIPPCYFIVSVKLVSDGVLRGMGKMGYFMLSTFSDLFLRAGLALVFSATVLGAIGVWCAWPIGWLIGAAVSVFFYRFGKWRKSIILQ